MAAGAAAVTGAVGAMAAPVFGTEIFSDLGSAGLIDRAPVTAVAVAGRGASTANVDGEAALKKRLGLGGAALLAVQPGQSVEGSADQGVVGAERLLVDGEAALKERLGVA